MAARWCLTDRETRSLASGIFLDICELHVSSRICKSRLMPSERVRLNSLVPRGIFEKIVPKTENGARDGR